MDNHTFEDDLTSTVPRADPQFQDQLEAAFLDRIRQEKQQMFMTAQQKRGVASLRFSLTGLAAVLALVIVGIVVIYASQSEPESDQAAMVFKNTETLSQQYQPEMMAYDATGTALSELAPQFGPYATLSPIQRTSTVIVWNATGTASALMGEPISTGTPTAYPTNTPFPTGSVVPMESSTPLASVEAPYLMNPGTPDYFWPSDASDYDLVGTIPQLQLVYIAAWNIPNGEVITLEDVIPTYWPVDTIPGEAFRELRILQLDVNAVATRDIPQWQPILNSDLRLPQ